MSRERGRGRGRGWGGGGRGGRGGGREGGREGEEEVGGDDYLLLKLSSKLVSMEPLKRLLPSITPSLRNLPREPGGREERLLSCTRRPSPL